MTQIHQEPGPPTTPRQAATPGRGALIGIGALLVVLTNAVIFSLPPLLPVIQAQYGLATVAESTWLYTVADPRRGSRVHPAATPRRPVRRPQRHVAASVFLTVGALVPAVGDSYPRCWWAAPSWVSAARPSSCRSASSAATSARAASRWVRRHGDRHGRRHRRRDDRRRAHRADLSLRASSSSSPLWRGDHPGVVPARSRTPRPPSGPAASASLGTVWMIGWVAAILLTLTQGLVWGNAALIPLVLGMVGGIAWIRVERRSSTAVFDVALMKAPLVTASCICIALFAAVNSAFLLLLSTMPRSSPRRCGPSTPTASGSPRSRPAGSCCPSR